MYYYGTTHTDHQNALMNVSDLISDSFAFNAAYTPDDRRTFGVALVSPMRIRSGSATVNLPVVRDAHTYTGYRQDINASIKPSAREYDLGFYYSDQLTDNVLWQSELGVRLNPDHQAGARPDYRSIMSLKIGL